MAEYIDREALIFELARLKFGEGSLFEKIISDGVYTVIEAMPAADVAPKWISVKDRLPDVNRTGSGYEEITVIATDGESVRPMIYERACIRGKTKYRWKWIWDRIYEGKPIVAWMPLPEPPEEAEKSLEAMKND